MNKYIVFSDEYPYFQIEIGKVYEVLLEKEEGYRIVIGEQPHLVAKSEEGKFYKVRTGFELNSSDNVNKPSHYTQGDIETIDYIRDKLTAEQFEGYCIGNVIKYLSRYRLKNGKEDLEKAKVYLEWAIESYNSTIGGE